MTLNAIFAAIRATSSKLEKRAILAKHKDNELLSQFLNAVYNPRIQYGIKKLPTFKTADAVKDFGAEVIEDLQKLADREYTGAAAKTFLASILGSLDEQGRELVKMVIARDVDAGIAENSVLEVWPGLFFIPPYQRCAGMDEKVKERFAALPYFYVQTKSDGQFVYAINRKYDGSDNRQDFMQAMSRAGSIYPAWVGNHITYGMPAGYVAMGEMLVVRDGKVMSRKDGNGVLNSVLSGDGKKFLPTDSIRFLAWDMVTVEEFEAGESVRQYQDRWADLMRCTSLSVIPHWTVNNIKDAGAIHNARVAEGEEGTVWKNPEMGWRDCQSGDKNMVKVKVVFEAEYEIVGAYVHKKNPDMLGGFNVKTSDGLVRFDVGSGFDDGRRLQYWHMLKTQGMDVFNGTICTCEGNDIVASKSKATEAVFLPIFVELRLDKTEADSRERVWEQFEAAKLGKKL